MARTTAILRFVIVAGALVVGAAQGCSKQGEGERCEPLAGGDNDCDDGLKCVEGKFLANSTTAAPDFGRCCPDDNTYTDSRCAPVGTVGPDGGLTGGTSGVGGEANAGGGGEPASAGAGGQPPSTGGAGGQPPSTGGAGGQPPSTGGAGGDTTTLGGASGAAGAGGA
jgi:hypothetical protein